MHTTLANLLIVDDEPVVRESLSLMLAEMGYRVRAAEDGFSALREMQDEVPELLLSDLNMPRMSGFELLSVVRRRFPAIRTIAMSGWFSGNEAPSGIAADGFYQKGSSVAALMRIIETLPPVERHAHQPSSPDAPLWIHRNTHDFCPDAYVTITCPECLRSFPQSLGAGYLNRKTDCIYCRCSIHYAIAPSEDQVPMQVYQRKSASVARLPQSAPCQHC
ncbi:MAG: response regulator [Terracidiphilus sp.]